jgi:hypothetical protein
MTTNAVTINLDDINLAEIIRTLIIDAGLSIHELFDDDDIIFHIQESGIPIEQIYEEDEILNATCVTDKMLFMDPNGVGCERCNEPVLYEGNEGKISKCDDAIICEECYAREHEEAKYSTCSDCRRMCYNGGAVVPDDWVCADCDEDEEEDDE